MIGVPVGISIFKNLIRNRLKIWGFFLENDLPRFINLKKSAFEGGMTDVSVSATNSNIPHSWLQQVAFLSFL